MKFQNTSLIKLFTAFIYYIAFAHFAFAQPSQLVINIGHNAPISSLNFSPNGKLLISGATSGVVKLWEVSSGYLLAELERHANMVTTATFSPNGKAIATCSFDKRMRLWDVQTKKKLWDIEAHDKAINGLAFSPDGALIASVSYDKKLKLWNAQSGQLLQTFVGHQGDVKSVDFSADGQLLLTASADKTMRIWDIDTGETVALFPKDTHWIRSAHFLGNNDFVVSKNYNEEIKFWNIRERTIAQVCKVKSLSDNLLAFRDENIIYSQGDQVNLIGLNNCQAAQIISKQAGNISSLALSRDQKMIAIGNNSYDISIWKTNGERITLIPGFREKCTYANFSKNGRHVVIASHTGKKGSFLKVTATHLYSDIISAPITFNDKKAEVCAIAGNNQELIAGFYNGSLEVWKINAQKARKTNTIQAHTRYITGLHTAFKGHQFITASADNTAKIWDTKTKKVFKTLEAHRFPVIDAVFTTDDKWVVTGSTDQTAIFWSVADDGRLVYSNDYVPLRAVAVSPTELRIVTGNNRSKMKIWDIKKRTVIRSFKLKSPVNSFDYSPDGKKLLAGLSNGKILVWDTRNWRVSDVINLPKRHISRVAYSPDGKKIMASSWDGKTRIYNASNLKLMATIIIGLSGKSEYVVFTPEGYYDHNLKKNKLMYYVDDQNKMRFPKKQDRFFKKGLLGNLLRY